MIRPARPTDVPALATLAQRTWSEAFGWSVDADDEAAELEATRSEAYFHAALARNTILVADDGGELVGYVQLGDVDIHGLEHEPGDRELHRLYVDAPAQGRGLGRRLAEAALANPRLAGARRVYLQVWEEDERAVRLYERLGFRVVGRTRFTIGADEVVEDLVMVLERRD